MKKNTLPIITILLLLMSAIPLMARTVPAQSGNPAGAQAKMDQQAPRTEQAPVYDEAADAKADIAAAVAWAGKENRRVLIQWEANWCGWCRLLHKLFHEDENIARKILSEYEVVRVDIGRFNKNTDLAESYDAFSNGFKKAGVPYLTVLDGAGRVVANQDTSVFEEGKGYDSNKVLDFLTKNQAPHQEAEAVLAEGLKKAGASGRRII